MSDVVLSLEGVSRSFGALKATDAVDLTLRRGEIHALIGPNGAGKSTLMALIGGALRPDGGRICLDGVDITALDMAARARAGLARSFQISSLIPDYTVKGNVLLALQARAGRIFHFIRPVAWDRDLGARADRVLERVGLSDRAGVPAAQLSHGERRMLEIALAIALGPRVFLLDEPMAGMGAEGARRLMAFLDGLRHAAPILLVEHDMDAVFALADRITVLTYGRVIATGPVEAIRANPAVRAAYLGEDQP